ncbi:MAG: glycosyltransferase [bacterium]
MKLSIIIICKNEERHIGACIDAALRASRHFDNTEVILVDSCSIDETVRIAKQYPIVVLQLRAHWRQTPAAGRVIGFLQSNGEFVMFVDGDSIICEGFLKEALFRFEENPKVAAISGRRREIYWKGSTVVGEERDINKVGPAIRSISVAPGSAIYRRTALNRVGCFNPYLFAEEEAELGERLIWGGFDILALPIDMVVHNTVPRERISSLFRRMKNRFHLGLGQVIRYRVHEGRPVRAFLAGANRALQFLVWFVAGCLSAGISALTNCWFVALSWMVISVFLILGFMVKSRSLTKPFRYIVIWSVQAYSIIRGFLLEPVSPSRYPTDVIVLKEAGYPLTTKAEGAT